MTKKIFSDKLLSGTRLEKEPFQVSFSKTGETPERYELVLADRSGTAKGFLSKALFTEHGMDKEALAEKVCNISGPVIIEGGEMVVIVKELTFCNDFKTADIFYCLSPEKVEEYKALIRSAQAHVKHEGYQKLLQCCLTEENLELLAHRPATLNYYGCYEGGALASTAVVTYMLIHSMSAYLQKGNELNTDTHMNWSLLLTASLLQTYGTIDAYTSTPFKKTDRMYRSGYADVLLEAILQVKWGNQITLTDIEWSDLKHVLKIASFERTSLKALSKEACGLRHMLSMYAELDAIDKATSMQESEDEIFFDRSLGRYLHKRDEKEGKEAPSHDATA